VYTPPVIVAGTRRWRQWHHDAAGALMLFLEHHDALEGLARKTLWLDGDGQVTKWSEERYDDAGELVEVVTYDAAGTVINREDNG
jgi:hypothetical protein